jgi:hypothetical protein
VNWARFWRLQTKRYGTALVLEEFGNVIARGGAGIVIASQSGHRLPPLTVEQNKALATTPVEELLSLPFLQLDKVTDSLHAYQISKRGNSLRVMAEAVRWGKRGARLSQQGEAGPHGCFSLWSKKQVARRTAGHHHGLTAAAGRKGGVLEPPRHGATYCCRIVRFSRSEGECSLGCRLLK